ncbi:MAG: hypothetical protein JNK77_05990 [Saprospiraceae bacterium]|nr:hypothetical protein [Saprospiraceae bacterium]
MTTPEISRTEKQVFNAIALFTAVLFLYLLFEVTVGSKSPNPMLVLLSAGLNFVMMLVSAFRLSRYPKGTVATAARKLFLLHGWYYMLLFLVGNFAIFMLSAKQEAAQQSIEETKRWEEPDRYHYLVFDQAIENVSIKIYGHACQATLTADGKTARYLLLTPDIYEPGDTLPLIVALRHEGQVKSYSFKEFIYNPAPDTFHIKINN